MVRIIILVCAILLLGAVAPLAAFGDEGGVTKDAELFRDPVAKDRALMVMRLAEKAQAGDQDALRLLEAAGQDLREIFPNGSMFTKGWSNAVRLQVEDWRNRKGEGYSGPTQDMTPRLQAAGAGLIPYRSPAPAMSRNILITRDSGTPIQTEPDICVNPNDPNHIVAGAVDYGLPSTSVYVSFDGGETWDGPRRVPLGSEDFFSADPVFACGSDGKVYHNFMSMGFGSYLLNSFPIDVTTSDIAVSVSQDGGMTWEQPSIVSTNAFTASMYNLTDPKTGKDYSIPSITSSFLDKNWMTVAPDGTLYVGFTNFTAHIAILEPLPGLLVGILLQRTTEIEVFRSADGGETWQKTPIMDPVPSILNLEKSRTSEGLNVEALETQHVQGSQLSVADDGTVYVSWYNSTPDGFAKGKGQIYVTKSSDKGEQWTKPVVAAEFPEVFFSPRSASFRHNSLPQMDVGPGPDGDVYIVYAARNTDKPSDDGDAWFVRGSSALEFTAPTKLNQDNTDRLQFFPSIAAGPDGALHAMWGDARDDKTGLRYHIYYTKSEDKGETWGFKAERQGTVLEEPDTRVTDFASNPNKGFPRGRFIGDYFAIDASEEGPSMVWADTRLGEFGPISQKIGFGRSKSVPAPEVFINPARGPAGQEVTLQAFNFQPDMVVFARIGGQLTSLGKTNQDGRLTYKMSMPIASEGTQDVAVFDESGNAALGSYFMDFGFGDLPSRELLENLEAQLAEQNKAPAVAPEIVETQTTVPREGDGNLLAYIAIAISLVGIGAIGIVLQVVRKIGRTIT